MKVRIRSFLIAVLLSIVSFSIQAQLNVDDDTEFLYALVEVEGKDDGSIGINILNSKVIAHPLRTPTESKGDGRKSNDLTVIIRDSDDVALDEIILEDVFTVDLEYLNDEGAYQHYEDVRKKKVILIRKVIDKNATSLSFIQGGTLKSKTIYNFKFRK